MFKTPTPEPTLAREPDDHLRRRIAARYDRWGALMSHLHEARGNALDELAAYFGLERQ